MALPPGEVDLHDVMGWAQEQTPFLPHLSQRIVLWYLCINAFRHTNNPEGREPGDVMSAYVPVARIQRGTGLTEKAVRLALHALQDNGYVYSELNPGNGRSRITVFWSAVYDDIRSDFRAGIKPLPKGFQRPQKRIAKVSEQEGEATIYEFPFRSSVPE